MAMLSRGTLIRRTARILPSKRMQKSVEPEMLPMKSQIPFHLSAFGSVLTSHGSVPASSRRSAETQKSLWFEFNWPENV